MTSNALMTEGVTFCTTRLTERWEVLAASDAKKDAVEVDELIIMFYLLAKAILHPNSRICRNVVRMIAMTYSQHPDFDPTWWFSSRRYRKMQHPMIQQEK